MIGSLGTYLPPWGTHERRQLMSDEDAVTMSVAAGRAALEAATHEPSIVRRVVVVSRELPLLQGGNAAAILAGLGLPATLEVSEHLGGAPATLQALLGAPAGTLVIGADLTPDPGAAAAFVSGAGDAGLAVHSVGQLTRSLPVATRDAKGRTTDYADPRLLRERGLAVSLERLGRALGSGPELDPETDLGRDGLGRMQAVAGLTAKDASALTGQNAPRLPTVGASAPLFALAAFAERGTGGRLLAVEQAIIVAADVATGPSLGRVPVARDEATPKSLPHLQLTPGQDIAISLAAYERAFDAKLRLQAGRCPACATLSYPPRYRCLACGSEAPTEPAELPREASVYTLATIHVPVPGLQTPYTVVLVELGGSGVRLLTRLTGAPPGGVGIGDRGQLVFRLVAVRSGVPDYGYAFRPTERSEAAA